MSSTRGTCAFCGAAAEPVPTAVIDDRCSRALGGSPVVALDHGSYRRLGRTVAVPTLDPAAFFLPVARAVCDYCANGWVDDVRTRAQPALLALATGPSTSRTGQDALALVRWAVLTAVLAELLDGMPTASSPVQRDALRRGAAPTPPSSTWFFSTSQRLPCRVHLSQAHADPLDDHRGVVQVVSIELARLTTLVVLPSDARALQLVERSALSTAFGQPARGDDDPLALLDLASDPHPHRVAVHRLCAASATGS